MLWSDPKLVWERVETSSAEEVHVAGYEVRRARVPNGWLVWLRAISHSADHHALTFVPDDGTK